MPGAFSRVSRNESLDPYLYYLETSIQFLCLKQLECYIKKKAKTTEPMFDEAWRTFFEIPTLEPILGTIVNNVPWKLRRFSA